MSAPDRRSVTEWLIPTVLALHNGAGADLRGDARFVDDVIPEPCVQKTNAIGEAIPGLQVLAVHADPGTPDRR